MADVPDSEDRRWKSFYDGGSDVPIDTSLVDDSLALLAAYRVIRDRDARTAIKTLAESFARLEDPTT